MVLRQLLTTSSRRRSFEFRRLLNTVLWLLLLGILTMIFFLGLGTLTAQPVLAAVFSSAKLEVAAKMPV